MFAKFSHAASKRVACAALLSGALCALGVSQSPTLSSLFQEAFDDDLVGATTANLAVSNKLVITNTTGSIVGTITGDRSSLFVVPSLDGVGNTLRLADRASGVIGYAAVQFTPSVLSPTMSRFNASFVLTPVDDGTTAFTCGIIDNEVTPGSGRIAKLTFLPNRKLALNDKAIPASYEIGHRYAIELSTTKVGPVWMWGVSILDLTTNAPIYMDVGLAPDDLTATPATLMLSTSDPGRGTFDIDSVELSGTP
ncbi:MAG: hypothetical protein IPH13_19650 [Planctomycetes bacterium]|nr:hypothetical protein [Planctomycetota bacterium]MCC7169472.1 hypothetical protein [Planctomycetota bacterium]